jgi:tetratricopeptide (TPR) repeat protein
MKKVTPFSRVSAVALVAILFALAPFSFAQEPQGGGGGQAPTQPPGGQPGGQPGGGGRQPGAQPNAPGQNQQQTQFPELSQTPIYLSGKVRLSDGSTPPDRVIIERVCNGVVRPEAYTDSKGNFSFQLGGRNAEVFFDASVGNEAISRDAGGFGSGRGISERDLAGCEIRGSLPGFQSESIMLGFRRALDNPDIGVISLHRLAKVEGYTFSITTALAPKDARKAYENGLNNMKKQKWPEAERELTKAVEGYPKYAIAWFELGLVYQQQKKLDDADHAYTESIKADSKFISPYAQLASVAVARQKWDDVVQYTSQTLKLNPYFSPNIYFYSAVANYNLQKAAVAEDHAREAAKLDTQHRIPKINHLLGIILAQKEDYTGAAENMQIYLKFSPNAPDVDVVKQQLADIEKARGERTTPQP